jgi:hypothetical protein
MTQSNRVICCSSYLEKFMPENIPTPQPNPAIPVIPVPSKDQPIIVPPGPGTPIKIDEPPTVNPLPPIRDPGTQSPPQLV